MADINVFVFYLFNVWNYIYNNDDRDWVRDFGSRLKDECIYRVWD